MSGNKSRFPGKSIIKNGKIRPRRSVCHRSKEEMANDSCVNTAKNIAKGLENSTIGDSDEDETTLEFHGFQDEEIKIFEEKALERRNFISRILGTPQKTTKAKISTPSPMKSAVSLPSVMKDVEHNTSLAEGGTKAAKVLIRPSKLGNFGTTLSSMSTPENSPFSRGQGKRQIKPSFKLKDSPLFGKTTEGNPSMKKSITEYANAVAAAANKKNPDLEDNQDNADDKMQGKIQRILASQWDSRLRTVDNKFVKTRRVASPFSNEAGIGQSLTSPPPSTSKPVLLRESKLVLNKKLLERLRKPSQQVEFYQAIQRSMQSADKVPPKLVEGSSMINPAGTALVEEMISDTLDESVPSSSPSATKQQKASNRQPGNIVCGICGAVRYYAFILQAKKFGTFSCEPCRKFISRTIRMCSKSEAETADSDDELFPCVSGSGMCVVPPVLRTNSGGPKKKSESADVRCQACWLKLCLIGYKLEDDLYDRLRSRLPLVYHDLLPESTNRDKAQVLLPHRGQILEFNRQVRLSRPLFDGFGSDRISESSVADTSAFTSSNKKAATSDISSNKKASHVVYERLPNGWSKKAVKRLCGVQKGKWDMYLITPDQKLLRSQTELKLYIAKSGAVIDSNIVNYALPKKTAKVDKFLQAKLKVAEPTKVSAPTRVDNAGDKKTPQPKKETTTPRKYSKTGMITLPKSSRSRETKVPLKYRTEEDEPPKITPIKKAKKADVVVEEAEEAEAEVEIETSSPALSDSSFNLAPELPPEELRAAIAAESSMVAVKSEPKRKSQNLSGLGVGTFSIDEDTAKGMSAGRFMKRIKIKRCGTCKGCRARNCKGCVPCLDMLKYGGTGQLKQACIERRCSDPSMPGLPAMSTFKKANDVKRKYLKTVIHAKPTSGSEKTSDTKEPSEKDEDEDEEEDDGLPKVEIERIPVPPRSNERPNLSYSAMVAMAIQNSKGQKASLNDIYEWIQDAFPYFSRQDKVGWQNSIRHNLSLSKSFYRTKGNAARKGGGFWHIDPKVSIGTFKKVKKSEVRPKSVKHDDSFWEPDNDSYKDNNSSGLSTPKFPAQQQQQSPAVVKVKQSSPIKRSRGDDLRQSLEEFVEMGMRNPGAASPNKRDSSTVYVQVLEHVPLPPTVQVIAKTSSKVVIKVDNIDQFAKKRSLHGLHPFSGSTDFYQPYDPEEVAQSGQSVITTETLPVEALCFLCGSAGEEEMLFCKACCEPYHPFCLNAEELPQSAEAENDWVCRKCAQCQICGHNEGNRMRCTKCTHAFHAECLLPSQRKMIDKQTSATWMCGECLRCKSCNLANVLHFDEEDSPLCDQCCLQKKKGSYCPLCEGCYDDNDYETRMMECAQCGGWIHAKCEDMDAEKYQILSYLPNSIDYVCKKCNSNDGNDEMAKWKQAVFDELKSGQNIILHQLMQLKCAKPFVHAVNTDVISQDIVTSKLEHAKRQLYFEKDDDHKEPIDESVDDDDGVPMLVDEFDLKDCSVPIVILEQPTVKECSITINDVKYHPWWGPIVRQLSGESFTLIRPRILKKSLLIKKATEMESLVVEKPLEEPSVEKPLLEISIDKPGENSLESTLETKSFEKPREKSPELILEKCLDLEETFEVRQEICETSSEIKENKSPTVAIGDDVLDLNRLVANVESNQYKSVLIFHLNFKRVAETVHVLGPNKAKAKDDLFDAYTMVLRQVFPWFDVQKPLAHFEPLTVEDAVVRPPYQDHSYADCYLKTHHKKVGENPPKWKSSPKIKTLGLDQRSCQFCGQYGDKGQDAAGRLLYFRQNDWVHANCAMWSSEVYEEVDGSLQNVSQALTRGGKLTCTVCRKKGATTGCCHEYCKENYHFECGLFHSGGAVFKEDKTVYCMAHRQFYVDIPEQNNFKLARTIHIDIENDVKKRQKPVDLRTVKCTIGSLTIESLGGSIQTVSDTKDALIPNGFTCSRWFWSTLDPSRRVKYYCSISLNEGLQDKADEGHDDVHLTIDHDVVKDTLEVEELLSKTMKALRKIEVKKAKRSTNILPPYAVSSLWKSLDHKDLHQEEPSQNIEPSPSKRPRIDDSRITNTVKKPLPEIMVTKTPPKTLNKAVSNILKRTPSKLMDDDLLASFKVDFPDSDLLASILNENQPEDDEDTDVTVIRTWFNQNKLLKLSEVSIQCNLPFTKFNWEMDDEYEKNLQNQGEDDSLSSASYSSTYEEDVIEEEEPFGPPKVDDVIGDNDSMDSTDILSYVMDKLNQQKASSSHMDMEILQKILDLPPAQEGDIDMPEAMVNNNIDGCVTSDVDKLAAMSEDSIFQLDGADDGDEGPKIKTEDTSPRKDFTIAGLLSPPTAASEQQPPPEGARKDQEAHSSSDDDVVFLSSSGPPPPPPPSSASTMRMASAPTMHMASASTMHMASASAMHNMTASSIHNPAFALSHQQLAASRMTPIPGHLPQTRGPSVYIQHLPSHQMASNFAQSFQQQTGRPLQYVASIPTIHQPQLVPYGQTAFVPQYQYSPASLFQPQPQPVSYMTATPQGIIFNQQPQSYYPTFQPLQHQQHQPQQPQQGFYNPNQYLPNMTSAGPLPPSASIAPSFISSMASTNSSSEPQKKKVARVQPIIQAQSSAVAPSGKVDPIKALSSMASQPMTSSSSSRHLSISHIGYHQPSSSALQSENYNIDVTNYQASTSSTSNKFDKDKRSVGTQAKIGAPLKIISPRPWKGSSSTHQEVGGNISSGVSASSSRPASNSSCQTPKSLVDEDHTYFCSSPDVNDDALVTDEKVVDGMKVTTKQSTKNAIKMVLQKNVHNDKYQIQEMVIQDGSKNNENMQPKPAIVALKAKSNYRKRIPKTKDAAFIAHLNDGQIQHSQEQFVNEVHPVDQAPKTEKVKEETLEEEGSADLEGPHLIYELTSEDGFKAVSSDLNKVWYQVFSAVQEARIQHGMNPIANNPLGQIGLDMLGLTHSALSFLIEQLPGAKDTELYDFKHHVKAEPEEPLNENPSGCARAEAFKDRSPLDMFSWLASRHRKRPNFYGSNQNPENEVQLAAARRATSLDLPMAMRFRHLAKNAKEAVGVFSSGIHGRGLFCKREIQAGEMVIEYAGEEIRAMLTDKREKYYESRGIGCYMFKIDDSTVIDATMKGNAARFINHSCDSNCYSKIIDIFGKKHIIIFAMRKILPGEELTYDYKFPLEDVKIPCHCSARRCRKYMN